MKEGVWHQCGDKSQKLVLEQLGMGNGVGVVLSPRDLSFHNASEYANKYRDFGVDIIIDLQFYNPIFNNRSIASYPTNDYRISASDLCRFNESQLSGLAFSLYEINKKVGTTALLSPGLLYEAGRNDIIDSNSRLFDTSKKVGDDLGIPTYSTLLVARSASISETSITSLLSSATSLNSDGWYYGFEFNQNRIPSLYEDVIRFGSSLITLACTGKPVLHSFAGPLALLSMGFGATAIGIGHSQNLWQFTRGRWEKSLHPQGGGGDAPPRYFSRNLWGTFVYPDELLLISPLLQEAILSPSPFSNLLNATSPLPWSRWEAGKHLINVIGTTISEQSQHRNSLERADFAINLLDHAIQLGKDIQSGGLILRDQTCGYQDNWKKALSDGINIFRDDYEYLSLIS